MNRELILEYAAKTEHVGVPGSYEATGRAAEPNCGDELVYYLSTKRDVVTEISYTITESACPPAKAKAPCTCGGGGGGWGKAGDGGLSAGRLDAE